MMAYATEKGNHEADMSVLGAMMFSGDAVDEAVAILSADDFVLPANVEIFRALVAMRRDGIEVDPVTLADVLAKRGKLDEVGVIYIQEICETVPHADHVGYYANIVKERSIRRQVRYAAEVMVRSANNESDDLDSILESSETRLHGLIERRLGRNGGGVAFGDALEEAFKHIDSGAKPGIPTGWPDLDRLLHGLAPGSLVYLAARPSVGKTALAVNLLFNVAKSGHAAMVFSLEQSRLELTQRFLALASGLNGKVLRQNKLDEQQRATLTEAANQIGSFRISIDDQSDATVSQVAAAARLAKRRQGIDLVVIDYLQLIKPEDGRAPREQQVAGISRRLKHLARTLEIPVVCLAQLNRQLENRESKRPRLSDLRESGAIEQDADVVLLLHRPAMYSDNAPESEAHLILAKHRNGEIGNVKLFWNAPTMAFQSAAFGDYAGEGF